MCFTMWRKCLFFSSFNTAQMLWVYDYAGIKFVLYLMYVSRSRSLCIVWSMSFDFTTRSGAIPNLNISIKYKNIKPLTIPHVIFDGLLEKCLQLNRNRKGHCNSFYFLTNYFIFNLDVTLDKVLHNRWTLEYVNTLICQYLCTLTNLD